MEGFLAEFVSPGQLTFRPMLGAIRFFLGRGCFFLGRLLAFFSWGIFFFLGGRFFFLGGANPYCRFKSGSNGKLRKLLQ